MANQNHNLGNSNINNFAMWKSKGRLAILLLLLVGMIFVSCSKDKDEEVVVSHNRVLYSTPENDGVVMNTTPIVALTSGGDLAAGWIQNYVTKGYLSFKMPDSLLAIVDKKFVLESAVIKLYQTSYSTNVFSIEGVSRVIRLNLVDYGDLDITDYDSPVILDCGVIAASAKDVLSEYSLVLTAKLKSYITEVGNLPHNFQFQIECSNCVENVDQMSYSFWERWSVFSSDEQPYIEDYQPRLIIRYHWEDIR